MTQNPGVPGAGTTYVPETVEVRSSDFFTENPEHPDSTKDQAKEQAGHVAGVAQDEAAAVGSTAADAGQHVAGVAKEQASNVASEAAGQARQVVGQARDEAQSQLSTQQQRAAGGLHSIGQQLGSMADGARPGVVTDLTQEAATRVREAAGWLENREPGDVLSEVKAFARRRPGTFLALAAGAGLVAGRLTRGLTAPSSGDSPSAKSDATPAATPPVTSEQSLFADPTPASPGYPETGRFEGRA